MYSRVPGARDCVCGSKVNSGETRYWHVVDVTFGVEATLLQVWRQFLFDLLIPERTRTHQKHNLYVENELG